MHLVRSPVSLRLGVIPPARIPCGTSFAPCLARFGNHRSQRQSFRLRIAVSRAILARVFSDSFLKRRSGERNWNKCLHRLGRRLLRLGARHHGSALKRTRAHKRLLERRYRDQQIFYIGARRLRMLCHVQSLQCLRKVVPSQLAQPWQAYARVLNRRLACRIALASTAPSAVCCWLRRLLFARLQF